MRFFDLIDRKKQRRHIKLDRRKIIFKRDGKRCRYCRSKVKYEDFHVDHIKPVSHHGNDYVFNLCCACASCNLSRSNKERIRPSRLPLWRKIYGILLVLWYTDIPEIKDFV